MKRIRFTLILIVLLAATALADTLYLKNGSVLKGTFIGFENGEFVFELTSGNRLKIRPSEVSRLVMERDAPAPAPPVVPPRDPRNDNYPSRNSGNNPTTSPGNNSSNTGGRPGWENLEPFDVALENQWIRSQIRVERGQRVRVDASGTIYLEGRTAVTPDGLNRRDREAPMPNENDGGLIAAVGQEQDSPPIFIGRSREFTADRAGILYFTVNHWETRDARGSFRVNVAIERGLDTATGGNAGGGRGNSSGNVGTTRPPQGRTKTITIYADQAWTDTGIDLEPNAALEITAEGQLRLGNRRNIGPDGEAVDTGNTARYPVPNAGAGALIGKIRYRDGRDSNFIFIGARGNPATEPGEYGRLFLGINDDNFRDNSGSYRVTIRY